MAARLTCSLRRALLAGLLSLSPTALPDALGQAGTGATELRSEIRRDINRYRWVFGGRTSVQSSAWSFGVDSRFTSDAFVLFSDRLSFRDELAVDAAVDRTLGPSTAVRVSGSADWYSLSRVLQWRTLAGLRLRPAAGLTVEPRLGVALDRRPGVSATPDAALLRTDAGPAIGWAASWRTATENYRWSIETLGDARRIEPRRDFAFVLAGNASGNVERTRWAMRAAASSFRRDTYESASFLNRDVQANAFAETIEQTSSDTLAWSGELETPVYGPVLLVGSGGVMFNRRRVRAGDLPAETLFFETDFDRRSVDLDLATVFDRGRARLQAGVLIGAETESRSLANRASLPPAQAAQKSAILQQADADRGYFGIAGAARVDVGSRTTVSADGTLQLTRHDTPEVNPDDRDERSASGQLAMRTRLAPALDFDARLFASRYETVYIKAERSAENSIQNALRLQTNLIWHPSPTTRVRVGPEVRATYTIDAFEIVGRQPRDQSARELRYELEAEHRLTDGIAVLGSATLSDLRLGRFIEDTFSEIPFDTLGTTSGQLRVRVGRRHTAEVGIRLYRRSDYNLAARVQHRRRDASGNVLVDAQGNALTFTTTRPGRDIVRQIGPVAAISWNLRDASVLRLDGWLTFQKQYQEVYGELPEADAAEIRSAASRGRSRLIPNVAMTVQWRM